MITVLAGGVGAARFLQGLIQLIDQRDLTVIVNTGDDIQLWGLYISPDIDTIVYTLAGVVDEAKGWGIKDDTFACLNMARKYGLQDWFQLGDRDLATHIFRTSLISAGWSLTEITSAMCRAFGVRAIVLPMSNEKFQTKILTDLGLIHFQEYLVKRGAKDIIKKVVYEGAELAEPAPGVLEALTKSEKIIIAPSNPIASIGTILSIRGIRDCMKKTSARIAAISPLIRGKALKGPADKMMANLGLHASARQIAQLYGDFLDVFVIDSQDSNSSAEIENDRIKVVVANTIMKTKEHKRELGATVLASLQ